MLSPGKKGIQVSSGTLPALGVTTHRRRVGFRSEKSFKCLESSYFSQASILEVAMVTSYSQR